MNIILLIILFLLMIYVDRNRGLKLFISLCINFIILLVLFYFIALGINPIVISLIGCFILSYIILYFINGKNVKTESSLISITIVLILLAILIFTMTELSRIAGFGYEAYEDTNMFSYNIGLDFTNVAIAITLLSLIGATTDASIAISSALYEVYENNKHLKFKELFLSGISIGKDILCTTTNTLLFAFLGDFMTLMLWYYSSKYSFLEIINAKTFAAEFIRIMFSAVGCVLVIPLTSYITSKRILRNGNNE